MWSVKGNEKHLRKKIQTSKVKNPRNIVCSRVNLETAQYLCTLAL